MKLCIQCANHAENHGIHTCQAEQQGKSLVTGEPLRVSCTLQRGTSMEEYCGPDARWFLPIYKAECVEFPPKLEWVEKSLGAPLARCTQCARRTWDKEEVGALCKMTQPSGNPCIGVMLGERTFAESMREVKK